MKIAVVAAYENVGISDVEYRYLAEYIEHLRDLNHEVMLFAGEGVSLPFTKASEDISVISLEAPSSGLSERYLSQQQCLSDQILSVLYREYENHIFDAVEFLGCGGMAVSTIRAKKTWGLFENVKFVVHVLGLNSLFARMANAPAVSSTTLSLSTMETYVCRNADVVTTPLIKVKEFLKSSVGRLDVQLSHFWFDKSPDDEVLAVDDRFKKLFEGNTGSEEAQLSVEEILSIKSKKILTSRQSKILTLYIEYCGEGYEHVLNRLAHSGLQLEVFYFVGETDNQDSFESFSPEFGEKLDQPISSVNELFTLGQGDYVMFVQDSSVLSYSYLESAVDALKRNPMLGWVGAYVGRYDKYPIGYVPSLSSFRNTCPPVGAVFCRPSLERLMEAREILFRNGFEWDIFVGLHDKYVQGDIIPHVFFSAVRVNEYDVFAKEIIHSSSLSKGQNAVEMLNLLLEEPDHLNSKVYLLDEDSNREEFRVLDFVDSDEIVDPPLSLSSGDTSDFPVSETNSLEGNDDEIDETVEPSLVEETDVESEESLKIRFSEEESVDSVADTFEEPEDSNPIEEAEDEQVDGLRLKLDDSEVSIEESHPESPDTIVAQSMEVLEDEQVEVLSTEPSFQLFWAKDWVFSEGNSMREESEVGEDLYKNLDVSSDTPVNTLRIDPCDCEGRIFLRRIQIIDQSTNFTVFSVSEENAFDNIRPEGDFEVEGIEGDSLVLLSTGTDPQILIELVDVELTQFSVQIEYGLVSYVRKDKNLHPEV